MAEYLGTILIPIFFVGMIVSIRYTFAGGGSWSCSGSGCMEEFDRLRGWTFWIPLFPMVFISTFGFVAAIILRIWGRGGRPPTFERQRPSARPALTGVGRTLTWVGILELALAGAFAFARLWLVAAILGAVGLSLVLGALRVAAATARSNRVLETGTPAVAEITDVDRTGASLNGNPMLRLTLTIYQDGSRCSPSCTRNTSLSSTWVGFRSERASQSRSIPSIRAISSSNGIARSATTSESCIVSVDARGWLGPSCRTRQPCPYEIRRASRA